MKNLNFRLNAAIVPALISLTTLSMQAGAANRLNNANALIVPAHASLWPSVIRGHISTTSGRALAGVSIVSQGIVSTTDSNGDFQVAGSGSNPIIIKKPGYHKVIVGPTDQNVDVALATQQINGVYMQTGILKSSGNAEHVRIMNLLKTTEINALVVDYKDDSGHVSTGLKPYVEAMHAQGVYMIARVVSMKDNVYPRLHPEMALIDRNTGAPWRDKKGTTYLNPFSSAAQGYLLSVAKRAAADGFDEVEFDYIRFPTDGRRGDVRWSNEFTANTRTAAIAGFLMKAHETLGAMGVFTAADVFGDTADVATSSNSGIGQRIGDIAPYLDYVCPMVYPSGYAAGQDGYSIPTDYPGQVVQAEIRKYKMRSGSTVVRPWLQAFKDYAFNHRLYGGSEIRAQIDGSAASGANGFILWNASNHYTPAGLKQKAQAK